MHKYINVKQLYFLIFIVAAYGLMHLMRSNSEGEGQNQADQAGSNLDLPFRSLPLEISSLAKCQQDCLHISDSSLTLLMKYGWAETAPSPPYLEGNSLSGQSVKAYLTLHKDWVRIDSFALGGSPCLCDEPGQSHE